MREFMITLLTCSVSMSVIALLYIAAMPLLTKRYSAKWCYYAWLIFIIGLIIPFRPQVDADIIQINIPDEIIIPDMPTINEEPIIPSESYILLPDPAIDEMKPAGEAVPAARATRRFTLQLDISFWQILVSAWFFGAMLFLVWHGIKYCRFKKMVERWNDEVSDEQALTVFNRIKTEMRITRHIRLLLCPCVGSPTMLGFVKPEILLPELNLNEEEISLILKHELIHYKRKDLYYKLFVLIATAIHWFNPIVHLMARAVEIQCELSCDAAVVQNSGKEIRLRYIETIAAVIKYHSKQKTKLSTNFFGSKKDLKKRLVSIMDETSKKAGFFILGLVLGTALAASILAGSLFQTNASAENTSANAVRFDEELANDSHSGDSADTKNGQSIPEDLDRVYDSDGMVSATGEEHPAHGMEISTVGMTAKSEDKAYRQTQENSAALSPINIVSSHKASEPSTGVSGTMNIPVQVYSSDIETKPFVLAGAEGSQSKTGEEVSQGKVETEGNQGKAGTEGSQGKAEMEGSQGKAEMEGSQGKVEAEGSQGKAEAEGSQNKAEAEGSQDNEEDEALVEKEQITKIADPQLKFFSYGSVSGVATWTPNMLEGHEDALSPYMHVLKSADDVKKYKKFLEDKFIVNEYSGVEYYLQRMDSVFFNNYGVVTWTYYCARKLQKYSIESIKLEEDVLDIQLKCSSYETIMPDAGLCFVAPLEIDRRVLQQAKEIRWTITE